MQVIYRRCRSWSSRINQTRRDYPRLATQKPGYACCTDAIYARMHHSRLSRWRGLLWLSASMNFCGSLALDWQAQQVTERRPSAIFNIIVVEFKMGFVSADDAPVGKRLSCRGGQTDLYHMPVWPEEADRSCRMRRARTAKWLASGRRGLPEWATCQKQCCNSPQIMY